MVFLLARTIALDFTLRQILKANIKLSSCDLFGFFLETILKSFFENLLISSDCIKKESATEFILKVLFRRKLEESIILKFFLDFKILSALLSKPFATITSRKVLFSSKAIFLFILKLQETIPPKALIGSQAKAER